MKRIILTIILIAMSLFMLSACDERSGTESSEKSDMNVLLSDISGTEEFSESSSVSSTSNEVETSLETEETTVVTTDTSPSTSAVITTAPATTTTPKPTTTTTAPVTTTKPATTTTAPATTTTVTTTAPTVYSHPFISEVVRLVNIERAKEGLSALAESSQLNSAANIRAQEIIIHNEHERPDGRTWYSVLDELDIDYRTCGENIAGGQQTPQEVVTGWMNSPGHRANIMSASYGKIGVGYVTGGFYGHNWVQLFTN